MTARTQLAAQLAEVGDVRTNESMAHHTTFGVGGPADIYVVVRSAAALAQATRLATEAEAGPFVLGSGSNIVVAPHARRPDVGVTYACLGTDSNTKKRPTLGFGAGAARTFQGDHGPGSRRSPSLPAGG